MNFWKGVRAQLLQDVVHAFRQVLRHHELVPPGGDDLVVILGEHDLHLVDLPHLVGR